MWNNIYYSITNGIISIILFCDSSVCSAYIDQWNRVGNPEIESYPHGKLLSINVLRQLNEESLFNKWIFMCEKK